MSISDDTHTRLVFEDAVDVAVEIGIPKVVVDYPDRALGIGELSLLVRTILAKAG